MTTSSPFAMGVVPSRETISTSGFPAAIAPWRRGRASWGSVKMTVIGSSWVTSTMPVVSAAWTTLPGSTMRTPVTPSIGDVMRA